GRRRGRGNAPRRASRTPPGPRRWWDRAGPGALGLQATAAGGEPFADQAIVLGLALGGVPGAEIEVLAVEGDDRPAAGPVQAVGGELLGQAGHVRHLRTCARR